MLELLTLPLISISVVACILAWFVGMLVGQFNGKFGTLLVPVVSAAVAYYHVGALFTTPFLIIALSPGWIPFVLLLVWAIIGPQLAKRGYLGKVKQWEMNHDFSDKSVAAKILLDESEIEEVAQVSASSEDYEQNLIRAANLEDHETDTDLL